MNLKNTLLSTCFLLFLTTITFAGINRNERDIDNPSVMIYPNPVVDGRVTIKSGQEFEKIEIVSIVGHIVYTNELKPSKSARLFLERVKQGIYLMRITYSDNTSITKRIWVK